MGDSKVKARHGGQRPVPRIIHRVWLGDPMPGEFSFYGEEWARLHPGWTVKDWTDEHELPPLRNQRLYDEAPTLVPDDWKRVRSDIVRLELLHRYGGVYADTDFQPVRSLTELPITGATAWAAWEAQDEWVCNAIMGAPIGAKFIDRLLDALDANVRANLGGPTSALTGPRFLTGMYRQHPAELTVLNQHLFYPYSFSELHRANEDFPQAFAIHRWANRRAGRDSKGRPIKCVA